MEIGSAINRCKQSRLISTGLKLIGMTCGSVSAVGSFRHVHLYVCVCVCSSTLLHRTHNIDGEHAKSYELVAFVYNMETTPEVDRGSVGGEKLVM